MTLFLRAFAGYRDSFLRISQHGITSSNQSEFTTTTDRRTPGPTRDESRNGGQARIDVKHAQAGD